MREAEKQFGPFEASIHFVGEQKIKTLNRQYRGVNRPTDVLSFPTQEGKRNKGPAYPAAKGDMGDLFLCVPFVVQQAKRFGVSPLEEARRMVIHGVLHLFGYDHMTSSDAKKMFPLQEAILKRALFRKKN